MRQISTFIHFIMVEAELPELLPEGAKKSEMKWEEEEEKNNETELLCLIKNYTRSWVAYSLA